MKVLMVNKFLYPNGGSETYMIKLGEYLASLGHHVQYFGMDDEKNTVGNDCGAYVPNMDFHSAKGSVLQKAKLGLESIYSRTARSEIRKVLRNFKPDIVHLNNINFQLTPAIIYEIKGHGIPIVQTAHDVQIACPCHRFYIEHKGLVCEQCVDGKYFHCIQNKCLQGSAAKSAIAAIESYYYHLRDTYNLVDLYICPSKFLGEKIMGTGVEKKRIKILYNFAEKAPNTAFPEPDEKYALYFGRLSKEKGILSLLQVCSRLPEVKLIVAGKGPLEDDVAQKAEMLPNVRYVGFKTGQALQELIAGAVFCIMPSEWYENCPLSVVESQVLGTPVVGSDLGGTKELIQHGKTGLLYTGCDNGQLESAICRLWNDETLAKEMGRQCKNTTWMGLAGYAGYIVQAYQKLAEGKGAWQNAE